VRRNLAESSEWQEALVREQHALALLDVLEPEAPSRDLSAAILDRLHKVAVPDQRPSSFQRYAIRLAALAATILIITAAVLPMVSRSREAARRASSTNNLKQLGMVFKMYANESKGEVYPPLSPYEGVWMFDIASVYPKYLSDLSILVNPSLPDAGKLVDELKRLASTQPIDWEAMTRIAARSYTYTGYAADSVEEVRAIAEDRRRMASLDMKSEVDASGKPVYRLREGVERFFISDINNPAASANAQSSIPVLVESVDYKSRQREFTGANVLYMDGHVGFVKENEAFPVLESVREILTQTN
ncbi:MAG: DUF1559 domain-containing protein, partial [Candidatus Hydrogenedentes bacterium]|nr:DUF1559 domain-containing protein [Candidatus Hydrogenedentota bacterium]